MAKAPRSRNRRHTLSGKNTFTLDMDTSGLEALLDELGEEAEEAIRPAAQAGAQVLYNQVKANVAALGRVTGNLDRSIYQVYSETKSGPLLAAYDVSWNHKKAPHGHLVEYGYLQRYRYRPDGMGPMVRPGMEDKPKPRRRASQAEKDAYYVTLDQPRQVPGKAFVRRAESAFDQAFKAAEDELFGRIGKKTGLA